MNIATLATLVSMVGAIGGGGYWFKSELDTRATKEALQVVASKAEYSLDVQMEYLLSQINRLQAKPNKTQDDYEQLRYLRSELRRLRQIRQIRKGG